MSSAPPGFFQGTEMPDAKWWQTLWPNPAQTLTLVGLGRGMDAIDLCCGDGWFTLPMAKIARHVMAVDIDAKMLVLTSSRLARDRLANCDYQLGDAYDSLNTCRGRSTSCSWQMHFMACLTANAWRALSARR